MNAMTRIRGLRVSFNGTGVLHGIDLDISPGRCVAVVGESGTGKSVLARSLIGLASEGEGPATVSAEELTVAGQDMTGAPARRWRALRGHRVGFVLQDALQSLDPLRKVGAEVVESLLFTSPRPSRAERTRRVNQALSDAGLPDAVRQAGRRSAELSGGMRQRALIASAIVAGPDLIIADEPTTALDSTVATGVLDLLGSLRDEGTALLLITHDLGAARRIADDVVVLAAGRVVESGPLEEVFADPQHEVTRALLDAVPSGPRPARGRTGETILSAHGLHMRYPISGSRDHVDALDGVDVEIARGEVLGVVGESGSGKSTLARVLLGMERPSAGTVETRARMRLVPQDPLGSFDPRFRVEKILRYAIRAAGTDHTPETLLDSVHLPAEVLTRHPRVLSGGMRQRVAIARALAADPELLVLDEPTSALDMTVQRSILELLSQIQERSGMAMVFISHDLAVTRSMSDRIAVMHHGQVVESGPTETVWSDPTHEFTRRLLSNTPKVRFSPTR